ncbi:MAG: FMN-binding protein, partial [Calditrichia bacterium]
KGMEIIQHSETPGVGAQVEKENFRSQWINLPLTKNIALRQDNGKIQGITGATYSSRAVVDGTNRILKLVTQHRDEIIHEIQAKAK